MQVARPDIRRKPRYSERANRAGAMRAALRHLSGGRAEGLADRGGVELPRFLPRRRPRIVRRRDGREIH
jgi:hypothetical protein